MNRFEHVILENESVVYVWDCDGVPEATCQRTRFESLEVVGEVYNNRLHDIERQVVGTLARSARLRGRIAEQACDLGLASVPSHHSNAVWGA